MKTEEKENIFIEELLLKTTGLTIDVINEDEKSELLEFIKNNIQLEPSEYFDKLNFNEKEKLGNILVEEDYIDKGDVISNMDISDIIYELGTWKRSEMYHELHDEFGDDCESGKYELMVDDNNHTVYDEILAKQLMLIHSNRIKLTTEEEDFIEKLSKRL